MNAERYKTLTAAALRRAVETMREACDQAERESAAGDNAACRRVMHSLTWGLANASSSIETAMSYVEDAHAVAACEAKGK